MSSKGSLTSARATYYTVLGGIGISSYLIYQHLLNLSYLSSEYQLHLLTILQTYDFGNAIAALVAVGGYLFEHWISRKGSKLEKQMERVEAQSHQFLVPVTIQWHSMCWGSLVSFVDSQIGELMAKAEHKEILDKYEKANYALPSHLETPTSLNNPISFVMILDTLFADRIVGGVDADGKTTSTMKKVPLVTSKRELPLILHNEIQQSDRNSRLWKSYEAFIRCSFVPGIQKIADIIDEHGHLMEPISPIKLTQMFGREGNGYGQTWRDAPRMWFYSYFLAYAKSWNELLAMWDDGCKDLMRPSVDFPAGLMPFNVEAQSIVAKVEEELIGMSQMHGYQR